MHFVTTAMKNERIHLIANLKTAPGFNMQFHPTRLRDACLVQLEPARDSRGFFARTFCVEEFAARGLETIYPQHSISFSARKGTVRGMHYQHDPRSEAKLVRCTQGSILDVIIDIRPDSPTYRRWEEFELSSANGHQLYIPKGLAHGFQTLSDDVEVNYLISTAYEPALDLAGSDLGNVGGIDRIGAVGRPRLSAGSQAKMAAAAAIPCTLPRSPSVNASRVSAST